LKEFIDRIKEVKEYETLRLAANIIVWKEGSIYHQDKTNRQFDELTDLLAEQKRKPFYLIDLSMAKRPDPENLQMVEERLRPLKNKFKHVAVYTGNNHLMFLGIKFYFIRFGFPSYSAHTSIKSALNSFS
jgi:hypothetical protein